MTGEFVGNCAGIEVGVGWSWSVICEQVFAGIKQHLSIGKSHSTRGIGIFQESLKAKIVDARPQLLRF